MIVVSVMILYALHMIPLRALRHRHKGRWLEGAAMTIEYLKSMEGERFFHHISIHLHVTAVLVVLI